MSFRHRLVDLVDRTGVSDRVAVWLVAASLCVLPGDTSVEGSGAADRDALAALSNSPQTASSSNTGTPTDLFVPVILTASGAGNSYYTSELTLTNRGSRAATLRYTYAGGGNGAASETLAPGRQKIVPNAIDYLRNLGIPIPSSGTRIGTLRVGASGSSEVSVTARTTTKVADGRAGLAYPGVAVADGFTEAVYLCGLRQNRQDRSNVAFQNMGAAGNITVRATVFSGDSGDSRVLPDVVLAPGGFRQLNSVLAKAGYTQGYVRVERVSGAAPFYAYGVINDQANSDGSFVFPVTESSLAGVGGQTLPVIIEHPNFSSELMVTNFSGEAKAVEFGFVADGIATEDRTARFSLTLEAGEQRILAGIVEEMRRQGVDGLGPAGRTLAGAVFATGRRGDLSGVVIGARTGSPGGGGQYSVFYNAVPYGAAFGQEAWIDALQQNEENRSNLALVNTGEVDDGDSVFQLDIYDGAAGQLVNTVTGLRLAARGWRQINGILDKYAPGVTQGYVRIRRISGNNPFLAYGVINDGGAPGQRSGDGAYLPASVARKRIDDPGTSPATDREVLEALYEATDGPNWVNNDNWLTDAPLGEWYGVETDGAGRVTSLVLSGNQLSGAIPPELGQLASLQYLGLNHNQLSGVIPAELGSLASLQSLELNSNQLSGTIPPELGGLANLQRLDLSSNQLSGSIPPQLAALANLQWLYLGENQLSGSIPPQLAALANLQRLDLSRNQLSGSIPPQLAALANLQYLNLTGNQLSGSIPPQLADLANLQSLDLGDNQLTGSIPKNLMQLPKFNSLDIRNTGVCMPADAAFQAWLESLSRFETSGITCDGSLRVFFSASSYLLREGETVEVAVRLNDHTEDPERTATIDLTAQSGGGATTADYTGVPENVTITAPASEASFVFTAVEDGHFDPAESVVLGFRRPLPSGITTGDPDTVTVTIQDPAIVAVTDREVLEALYQATGGPDWIDRTNWLSAAPLSEWFGVGTDHNERVTSLRLPGNQLSGSIPPWLARLTQLQSLDLGRNQLTGTIPPELGQLSHLQSLNLWLNQLTGTIPPELGQLSHLQWLYLGFNQLSGSIPPQLAALANLQTLHLWVNQLTGTIPPQLADLASLQWLYLGNNQLTGTIPPQLAALANLQYLDLQGNQLSGSIPPQLAALANLQRLHLGYNQLSGSIPPQLAALANLQRLNLGGNQLSGAIPPELAGLNQLQRLNLAGNQLSGSIPPQLADLANLQELDLSVNQLTGTIPPELGGLNQLQRLQLGGNGLSGAIPPELGLLTGLQWLHLWGNGLSGTIPPELAGLTRLEDLILGGNQLSGTIPPELAGLNQLQRLHLGGNGLSGAIPPELRELAQLELLDLSFNQDLSGTIPSALQRLPISTLNLMATSVCVPQDAAFQEWLTTFEFLPSGCGRPAAAMTEIDVAVVYTPAARRKAGGTAEIEAAIDLMVAETNRAYEDSGVNQRIGLVAREEVKYEENGDGFSAYDRLIDASDGHMDEVHEMRDRVGADLVHLIADVTNVGGIAQLPGSFGLTCADGCGGVVFAHELGHNMGLSHDRHISRSEQFPYSHGYVNQQAFAGGAPESARWRTIMSYNTQCEEAGFLCEWIMRFSNPDQSWLGDPLGVPGDERTAVVDGPADAVRTLNLTRHSVAGFRKPSFAKQLTMLGGGSPAWSAASAAAQAIASPGAAAGAGGVLFKAVAPKGRGASSQLSGGESDPATLRRREVTVDIGLLDRVSAAGTRTALTLNLFDDFVLLGVIEKRRPTFSGGYVLSGRLAGVAGGSVTLVINDSVVAGSVRLPAATYRIRHAGAGRHAIIQVDPSQFSWRCGTEP